MTFFALDDGKYGKGIINNCKTKIILNMEDEEAQRVKNHSSSFRNRSYEYHPFPTWKRTDFNKQQ